MIYLKTDYFVVALSGHLTDTESYRIASGMSRAGTYSKDYGNPG